MTLAAFTLHEKVALVTGAAAGGLGAEAAVALAAAGAAVAVTDLGSRAADLMAVAERIEPGKVLTCDLDVTDEASITAALDQVLARFGRLDIVVTAAGVTTRGPAEATSLRAWSHVLDVNLTGTWLVASRAAPHIASNSTGGSIITIASQYSSIAGSQLQSPYYASKGGVVNLTRALAVEYGRRGIRANAIAPGPFHPTRMTSFLTGDRLRWLAERTALGRVGDPISEIGDVVVFLASAASGYMTGQVLHVDGGWTAW